MDDDLSSKRPAERGFAEVRRRGLEPPPGYPRQALNLARQVSYASIPCQIVHSVHGLDDLDASDDLDIATSSVASCTERATSMTAGAPLLPFAHCESASRSSSVLWRSHLP